MSTRTRRRILSADLLDEERRRRVGFSRSVSSGAPVTDLYPSRFHITPWMSWSGSGGTTPTRTASTSHVGLGFIQNGAAADADHYEWNVEMASGTWSVKLLFEKDTDCGVFDVSVDGVAVSSGNDAYNGSATYNNVLTVTGVAVASSGNHAVRVAANTKNASSSDFVIPVSTVSGVRTGA